MSLKNDSSTQSPGTVLGISLNNWQHGAVGWPAVGGSYTDPNFGSTVRIMSAYNGASSGEYNYNFHYGSATGKYCFARVNATNHDILNLATGAAYRTNQPDSNLVNRANDHWDMVDDEVYYFATNATLNKRTLSGTPATVGIKTFASNIAEIGGSANTQSADGRYFVIRLAADSLCYVWDSVADNLYTGGVPFPSAAYVSITPDGKYLWAGGYTGSSPRPVSGDFKSFAINHGAGSVDTTGVIFWNNPSDHASCVTATDGKSYIFGPDQYEETIICIDMNVDRSALNQASMTAAVAQTFFAYNTNDATHFSAVSAPGARQNYGLVTIESTDDGIDGTETYTRAYQNECISLDAISGDYYRLSHHRMQGVSGVEARQPSVSCSVDGSFVIYRSNFNDGTAGTNELVALVDPLTVAASTRGSMSLR